MKDLKGAWVERPGPHNPKDIEHRRDARMGFPGEEAQNAVMIREHEWRDHTGQFPGVELTIMLPTEPEGLRHKLAMELRVFMDGFIARNDLEPK